MKLAADAAERRGEWVLCALLSTLGLSFWFFLGFPFANHNESYRWIAQMNQMPNNILDVLRWVPAASYRPLGSITAWLGFKLSGGSIYPQQVFNFVVAIMAWLILFSGVREKRLFSWISLVVGGAFFSGYIYLFHLHGVFYSPLLVFVAILTVASMRTGCMANSRATVIFGLAVLTSLYHPFALLIYVAFTLSHFLENRHVATRRQLAMGGLSVAMALVLMKLLIPTRSVFSQPEWALALSTSYKLAELKSVLSVISWLLVLTTVLSLDTSWRVRATVGIVATVVSLVFFSLHQPVLFVWVAVCLLKTALLRKWSMASLVVSTAILPLANATGSPTYALFALMVCSAVTPFRWPFHGMASTSHSRIVLAVLILACSVGVSLKNNVHLPVITELVKPILAEREKTHQLEGIIAWWMASDYTQSRLVLCQLAENPVVATNVVNRQYRAPASQNFLDEYISSITPLRNEDVTGQLLVYFGDERIADAEVVHTIAGRYNGQALVYRRHK